MSSLQLFRNQIAELIKARTPLFYLGSIETSRTLKELRSIASNLDATVQIFDFSAGILEGNGKRTATDPIGALDIILKRMQAPRRRNQHSGYSRSSICCCRHPTPLPLPN